LVISLFYTFFATYLLSPRIIHDTNVFTVEYSVRAAQMVVYEFLKIDRQIPPVTPHDKSLLVQFEALIKAFK
jgi:oleate hydratase